MSAHSKVEKNEPVAKKNQKRDPYEVLGVSRNSTYQEIKTAYRKMALNILQSIQQFLEFQMFMEAQLELEKMKHPKNASTSGTLAFDMDYARWLDEHQRQINDLRTAVNSHVETMSFGFL